LLDTYSTKPMALLSLSTHGGSGVHPTVVVLAEANRPAAHPAASEPSNAACG